MVELVLLTLLEPGLTHDPTSTYELSRSVVYLQGFGAKRHLQQTRRKNVQELRAGS